ncbi:asparagine synthase (glutamine-hydrolyzing) [Thiohalorhabdus methylotrophus]|uniref:asparagine synthase (glutamine-hydrolyzing) n=1 Tax=Thiohalorhabdus methylotrophus TaxID=3242694 RepID=A0ABV4TUZ4_9GAMM
MCGIAGFWAKEMRGAPREVAGAMGDRLHSRGPDDRGVWTDEEAGIALAHRRLAVIDLSPAGHQPMTTPCGRYTLVYNGEIYNHRELRGELEKAGGHFAWRGHSDTETLLAALRHWGLEGALRRLNGMFAFALWDAAERRLFLARDRMGEKPLYFGRSGGAFLFGSELKALAAHPEWRGAVDREALTLYLRHNYIPEPWSIYQGIGKLLPAHYVVIGDEGRAVSEPHCYWDLGAVAAEGTARAAEEPETLTDELEALLADAVGRRMDADVPLGAFLSGGYDSTTVAALMQAQSDRPVKTFSIGFQEAAYNEAEHARAVAGHLGTDHTELYVTPEEARSVIPELPTIWDEPFADSSQIPTYLVSRLARRHVTVSLSGDGGDELFCGYHQYAFGCRLWEKLRWLPLALRQRLASLLQRIPADNLDSLSRRLPRDMRTRFSGDRLLKLAEVLSPETGEAFYRALVSHWKEPAAVVRGAGEPDTLFTDTGRWPRLPGLRERMMYLDALTYLPGDILAKTDRATMAVSLEARVPMLDHRLVELAWRVPTSLKFRNGKGKWLLRQVLYRYVPESLMDRPKMGFEVPVEHWLRGPLREWAEDLLDERRLREEGFFHPAPVRRMWQEHLSGARRWNYHLWDVLMFQAWLRERPATGSPSDRPEPEARPAVGG